MRVGWSGELKPNQWFKVSLDEEDLRRLLFHNNLGHIDPAAVPVEWAFALLDGEAERMTLAKMIVAAPGFPADEGRARIEQLTAIRVTILAQLKEQNPT